MELRVFLILFLFVVVFCLASMNPISFAEPNSTACTAVMILQDTNLEGPQDVSLLLLTPNPPITGFGLDIATVSVQDTNRKFQDLTLIHL